MRSFSGYGLFRLIMGILLIIFGVYTVVHPEQTLTPLVVFYGITAVLTGISDILFYVRAERYTGFGPILSLITGIFSIMAGFMLFTYPNAGRWTMVLLIPIWFIAHSVSQLSRLTTIRLTAGKTCYYITLVVNIIGLVLGCMMIVWPSLLLFSEGFLIGAYLILLGVDNLAMAFSRVGRR